MLKVNFAYFKRILCNFFFHLIGNTDPTVGTIYETTNKKAENLSKIMFTMIFKIYWPLFVIPVTLYSYYNYYRTDAFHSFQLLYPSS